MAINPASDEPRPSAVIDDPPDPGERVMRLLRQHIPLTLLCDLSAPEGPPSSQILDDEGRPETTWWTQ